MGGKGSGGRRINSGPARTVGSVRWHREQRQARKAGAQPSSVAVVVPASVEAPGGMPADQRAVWDALSPHALAAGTLTTATALAFAELCEHIVVKRSMYVEDAGGTKYRGMAALVTGGLARFRLHADGKPVQQPATPEDPFAEFDGPVLVKRA